MLKRLYVHNYKCLVNFEINFDQDISLFLGANGSGKSTIFEVLTKLRRLILNEERVENIFDLTDFPRWLEVKHHDVMRFELDIEINKTEQISNLPDFLKINSVYKYLLVLEANMLDDNPIIILEESLYNNSQQLMGYKNGTVHFTGTDAEIISFDRFRSGINRYVPTGARDFLQYLRYLYVIRINPYAMTKDTNILNRSNAEIKNDCSNYAEWFAFLSENNKRAVSKLEKNLPDILTGFDLIQTPEYGRARILQVDFKNPANEKQILSYDFFELSEGQKCLIALYTLIYCTPENSLICIDEPENFLALPEIQPWLNTLRDQCNERNLQVILISHHPSLINFLTANAGYWFSKEDNHTRIQRITKQNEGGLSFAQLIELGWIYEG